MGDLIESTTNFFEFFLTENDDSFWLTVQAYIVIWLMKAKIFLMQNSWLVAKTVLTELGVSSTVNFYWAGLDESVKYYLTVLRVPDVIGLLLNARLTRFILGLF